MKKGLLMLLLAFSFVLVGCGKEINPSVSVKFKEIDGKSEGHYTEAIEEFPLGERIHGVVTTSVENGSDEKDSYMVIVEVPRNDSLNFEFTTGTGIKPDDTLPGKRLFTYFVEAAEEEFRFNVTATANSEKDVEARILVKIFSRADEESDWTLIDEPYSTVMYFY